MQKCCTSLAVGQMHIQATMRGRVVTSRLLPTAVASCRSLAQVLAARLLTQLPASAPEQAPPLTWETWMECWVPDFCLVQLLQLIWWTETGHGSFPFQSLPLFLTTLFR